MATPVWAASELPALVELQVDPPQLNLSAGDPCSQRVLVTGVSAAGWTIDLTREAEFEPLDAALIEVQPGGLLRSALPGETEVLVRCRGSITRLPVTARPWSPPASPSFTSDVLPLLSRAGCNAGRCHAKPGGKAGFQLSVFAHDPQADYREIVLDARGRRIFPARPDHSLLLRKPTLAVPHGGGRKLEIDSPQHTMLVRWIAAGMPFQHEREPQLTGLEVLPASRRYRQGDQQQLLVRAHYDDGTERDVTDWSTFASIDKEIATVNSAGLIGVHQLHGSCVVVVRYLGHVATSEVTVPRPVVAASNAAPKSKADHFIDKLISDRQLELGFRSTEICSDSEFIRRATLDTLGCLPTVEETRAFLADRAAEKRAELVERLLADGRYAESWANKWADLIRPNPVRVGVKSVYAIDQWLRESFRKNLPYDQFARAIITAEGSAHRYGPAVVFRDRRSPDEMVNLFSQIFLGVRLECAKCHHHPNEKWSQRDFYALAACFGSLQRKGPGLSPPISGGEEFVYHVAGGEVRHPVTDELLAPQPPGAAPLEVPPQADPRIALADWLVAPGNPFFAPAVVNRVWAEFMGVGLVEPVDDFRVSNPPSNPELLAALAEDFEVHGFDLKHLMQTIMSSKAYQRCSLPTDENLSDRRNYSRFLRRRLRAETLADALAQFTGLPTSMAGVAPGGRATEGWCNRIDSPLLDAFGRPDRSADCTCEREESSTLVQALHLQNSEEIQQRIASPQGKAAQLASDERLSLDQIINELYLAAYSRPPDQQERAAIRELVFAAPGATRQAIAEDVMWALINSAEFLFNH